VYSDVKFLQTVLVEYSPALTKIVKNEKSMIGFVKWYLQIESMGEATTEKMTKYLEINYISHHENQMDNWI
jgi:hypothetical protein